MDLNFIDEEMLALVYHVITSRLIFSWYIGIKYSTGGMTISPGYASSCLDLFGGG
ncbi:hypothetical protein HanRHA438_Chr03g0109651 [Helianthus annuus]|nr:hypothetical protein HanRHA438_Chr03g0109651 [Helianthus annuus]